MLLLLRKRNAGVCVQEETFCSSRTFLAVIYAALSRPGADSGPRGRDARRCASAPRTVPRRALTWAARWVRAYASSGPAGRRSLRVTSVLRVLPRHPGSGRGGGVSPLPSSSILFQLSISKSYISAVTKYMFNMSGPGSPPGLSRKCRVTARSRLGEDAEGGGGGGGGGGSGRTTPSPFSAATPRPSAAAFEPPHGHAAAARGSPDPRVPGQPRGAGARGGGGACAGPPGGAARRGPSHRRRGAEGV